MKRTLPFLAILLITTGTALERNAAFFRVERQSSDFVITWQVDAEDDVRGYAVYRKTAYSEDQDVTRQLAVEEGRRTGALIVPHGAGQRYRLRDSQVYKGADEQQVQYRLVRVWNNGLEEEIGAQTVNYTSTAVRRTWGSIKAMFQ